MKADFTRDTFLAANHFSRVLWQQGRVQLDADFNEQVSILLHYLQGLTADLIGAHGGPCDHCAFALLSASQIEQWSKDHQIEVPAELYPDAEDYLVSMGRYYVEGLAVEVDQPILLSDHWRQHNLTDQLPAQPYLIYLDVWEQLVTAAQHPLLREVALNGVDTAARSQLIWQIRVEPGQYREDQWAEYVQRWQPARRGRMRAQCRRAPQDTPDEPCLIPPDNEYRGQENQLYRVEIHQGGSVGANGAVNAPTYKWSRDNGSVIFPIIETDGVFVRLASLGRDNRLGLKVGDWVELSDDSYQRIDRLVQADAEPSLRLLYRVSEVYPVEQRVKLVLSEGESLPRYTETSTSHPLLRRWDHSFRREISDTWRPEAEQPEGILLKEDELLPLENGIQIYFEPGHTYQRGDYWLIPARTISGDIEWPADPTRPNEKALLPPHGVRHHYAPLAAVNVDGVRTDLRHFFGPLARGLNQPYDNCFTAPPRILPPDAAMGQQEIVAKAKPRRAKRGG